MTKQEVIDKIESKKILDNFITNYGVGYNEALDEAVSIVKQLDEPVRPPEPKPLEIEKPVVPQFVADWYEENKYNFELSVQSLCVHGCEPARKIDAWFDSDNARPIETLVMMHKFGYEIEREKLYTVEIPNPRSSVHYVLRKGSDDQVCLDGYVTPNWRDYKSVQLTEAKIKKDFEWAWQFAKEVEE